MKTLNKESHQRSCLKKLCTFGVSFVLSICTVQSAVAQVNLAQVPLFLKESVDSNLVFIYDDSGSMAWRYMPDDLGNNDDDNYYYSSHVNKVYYDPSITYQPPFKPDGSGRYPNSSYTNAWVNGFDQSDGADNLSTYIRFDDIQSIEQGFYMQFNSSSSCDSDPRQNSCYTTVLLNNASAEVKQNYANWFSYYSTRTLAAKSGITEAFFDLPDNIRIGYGAINVNNNTIDGVSDTDTLVSGVRPYTATRRQQFLTWLHNKEVNGGTPLRTALQDIGKYYSRTDDRGPWGEVPGTDDNTAHIECRQSFSLLMTDGIWNGDNPSVGNVDNKPGPSYNNPDPNGSDFNYTAVSPFTDGHSNTLADVAMEYWKNDLRTDLGNKVPVTSTDPAFWQHMTTFTIGLGVTGDIKEADALAALDPTNGITINWPEPGSDRSPQNIDDLLHAAINGRGGYASAQNPKEFAEEIQSFLGDVIARSQTSASSAAVSSAVLRADSLGFFAGFRSEDWSGTLSGFNFDLGNEIWDAEKILAQTLPANRKLITHNGSQGVELEFASASSLSNLSDAQRTALNADPTLNATQDNLGHNRVAWLHGDNDSHATLRNREGKDAGGNTVLRLLGDVINANPQFVGKTNYGFSRLEGTEGTKYGAFRSTSSYQNRIDALYVPANDGILHAFDGATGEELFGYIPSELLLPSGSNSYARISELMKPNYTHRYFMDGTPRVQDAYIDKDGNGSKEWRTVLLGTMGKGGKTIFALDITDPGSFSPANDVLWEFRHANLGYGVTDPQISRLDDGTWAAIFGNGYNGASGQSSLFVVNLETGALIEELQTGAGDAANANGLASATITSFPETDAVTRYAYGGDLLGNLWRFDLTGGSQGWDATKVFTAENPAGNIQPITVAPRVALNPNDNDELVAAFGTGSFLRSGDEGDYDIQTLYAIKDDLTASGLQRANLVEQTITRQEDIVVNRASGNGTNSFTVRESSSNPLTDEDGWYLDLVYNSNKVGERVISRATFPFGVNPDRVRFTTVIPDSDPCGSGRTGFIMDLKLTSGMPSDTPVFDLNSDGTFNSGDITGGYAPSGIQVGYGGENRTIATDDGDAEVVIPGLDPNQLSGDPCEDGLCARSLDSSIGRQTWEQLR
ncbi:PilC/PilY family type IV pilus protein [Marinobacter sp. 71-i]|uniref:PilC/PilY family type IV pilus protein n=1 Tax=Marinobacter iranensis TaxID=2962607 RepID=A0ABT5YC71_9GAMM|nr:PilC/PilY family type IV pilus protein [Marinobacter iranensis]MDF0751174.1 PilC/PilY family type IV pilus protein [Marinobacter iranensis]